MNEKFKGERRGCSDLPIIGYFVKLLARSQQVQVEAEVVKPDRKDITMLPYAQAPPVDWQAEKLSRHEEEVAKRRGAKKKKEKTRGQPAAEPEKELDKITLGTTEEPARQLTKKERRLLARFASGAAMKTEELEQVAIIKGYYLKRDNSGHNIFDPPKTNGENREPIVLPKHSRHSDVSRTVLKKTIKTLKSAERNSNNSAGTTQ